MPWLTNCELGLSIAHLLGHYAQETAHAMDAHPDSETDWLHRQLLELRDSTAELLVSAAIQADNYPSTQAQHDYQILRKQLRRTNRSVWDFEHSISRGTPQQKLTRTQSP
jgi:hypothetical protein